MALDQTILTDFNSNIFSSLRSRRDQRTLYRRAGGHLSLGGASTSTTTFPPEPSTATDSSREIIYPVNSDIKNHKSYFRRKVKTVPTRSGESSRDEKESIDSSNIVKITVLDNENSKESSKTNDDENSLDYGLMTLSAAGEGVKNKSDDNDSLKSSLKDSKKDEKQKTLSDQIAEGKYGLIEKELFSKTPKAPGIISYKTNKETPNDNEKTLGGLDKDEIWLAEDHLLILKGGTPNERKNNPENWKPIDDYEAPRRPVKIPLNPRVPPPFPVQLTDNGPLQFIGENKFTLFNPLTNETGLFANDPGHGTANFPQANGPDSKNTFTGQRPFGGITKGQVHDVISPPSWLFHNSHKDNDLLKQFPFNLPLPDQAFNRTEDFDEDDPSLFYPPPYSFVYKINYTNLAPVGPLVPGIILPPPPNFFSVFDPEEEKKPVKTPIDVINRINDIHLKNRLSVTSTTIAPVKSTTSIPTLREFTRKAKVSSTTSSSRLYKTKSTTLRPASPVTYSTTVLHSTTQKADSLKKIYPFDTTTLKLHPIYLPKSETTQLYSTTTVAPPPAVHSKPYQQDYGTQAHPIYFEYFDARTANPIKNPFIGPEYDNTYDNSPVYTPATSTTLPPSSVYVEPTKGHSKKPKSFYQPQFISSTISPHPQHVDTKFLFVTPKPDLPYGNVIASPQHYPVSTVAPLPYSYNTVPVQKPLVLKPVGKFDDEIAAIRQTLDFYNGKKYPQKAPKVKAVYEFSFEASKHKNHDDFQPMLSYDQKNYYSPKPEINLSQLSELIKTNGYYPSTTETTVKYYRSKQSATLPPKNNQQQTESSTSPPMAYGQKLKPQNVNYYVRPAYKEVASAPHQTHSQKIVSYPSYDAISVDHGYRINNRNVKYRKQPQQHSQQQQQFYGQASEVASLLNDTNVNYKHPQRPINPFSEFIDISRFPQNNPQHNPQNNPQHYLPHPPPPIHNPYYPGPYQRPFQQQYHQQPLDLLKFEYPQIPQINPDSVHITFYNRPMEKSDESYYVTPRN